GGIQRAARGKRIAADKGLVVFEQVIAAAIDHQEAADLLVHYLIAAQQALVQFKAFGIALAPVDALQELRGLYQFVHHLPLLLAQSAYAERHGDQLELGHLPGNVFIQIFFQQALVSRLRRRCSAPARLGQGGPGKPYGKYEDEEPAFHFHSSDSSSLSSHEHRSSGKQKNPPRRHGENKEAADCADERRSKGSSASGTAILSAL